MCEASHVSNAGREYRTVAKGGTYALETQTVTGRWYEPTSRRYMTVAEAEESVESVEAILAVRKTRAVL